MGWGKGRGFGPSFGLGPFGHHHHHHHHLGPNPAVLATEAAVVGAVAGVAIASATAPRPHPKPRPYQRGPEVIVVNPTPVVAQAQLVNPDPVVPAPPIAQTQPVVVASGSYPKAKGKGKGKGKWKGKGKGPVVVVDNTPPLNISSIDMHLEFAEIRGITYFYAVDVTPESGGPWRIMRSYGEFDDLFFKLGRQSFPAAPFPQSLDKLAVGDRRYDFGFGIGKCSHCNSTCQNRGDEETRKVYCSGCYPKGFPDPLVLQSHHRQLESWLQGVIQQPSSRQLNGPWQQPLRQFLEAGRVFISVAPARSETPTAPQPEPMTVASEAATAQHDEHGEMMSIEIPTGVTAGQIIAITVPNGNQVQLTVPETHKGGDTVTLWYDSVAGTLSHVDDSVEHSECDQTMSIEVPAGIMSGQIIAVTVLDGRQIQFEVPEGKKAGDRLDLWFDSTAGTLTPLI